MKAIQASSAGWTLCFTLGLCLAWLTIEHFPPWTAFHSDWTAMAGLCVGGVVWLSRSRGSIQTPMAVAVAAAISLVPLVQFALGRIYFAGDAWLAALYVLAFAAAAQLGLASRLDNDRAIELLTWPLVAAALASSVIAIGQWLNVSATWTFAMPIRPGHRPYSNFGQPNQLSTFLVVGLVSAWLLFEWRRIGSVTTALIGTVLLFGIALTGSRTGWAELGLLIVALALAKRRVPLRIRLRHLALVVFFFAGMTLAVARLTELFLLASTPRTALVHGTRPIHWQTVLDAIGQSPWLGYGWNQVAVGVAGVVQRHPASGEMIEHSHNQVLDLLMWNGLPLGLTILGLIALWLARLAISCRSGADVLILAMVGVVLVHALLELPLAYAYLLLPVGFLLGFLEAGRPRRAALQVPRVVHGAVLACGIAALSWIGLEYLELEQNHRELRLESAGIGTDRISEVVPDVVVLTQLRAYLEMARTQVSAPPSRDRLDKMRKVAERYGYPPVLMRYAIAAGLAEDAASTQHVLTRLCKQYSSSICEEARSNWVEAQNGRFPELRTIAFPEVR